MRRGDMLGSVAVSLRSFADAFATATSAAPSSMDDAAAETAQATQVVIRHLRDDDGNPVIGDDGQEATIAFYHR